MPISKVIGRQGQQCFKITNKFVSSNHVRIDYDEYRDVYTVTDLNSSNGTFIMEDRNGLDKLEYYPVQCVSVPAGTWLNLGGCKSGQGHHFLVNQVKRNQEDFSREFTILAERHAEYKQLLEQMEREQKQKNITARIIQGAITIAIVGLLYLILPEKAKMIAVLLSSTLGGALMGFLGMRDKKRDVAKKARENAQAFFVCPKCGRPLNEYMINARECMSCKAH